MTKKEREKALIASQNKRILDIVRKKSGLKDMQIMIDTAYDTPFMLYKWNGGEPITDKTLLIWKKNDWITQEQLDEIMEGGK